MSSTTLALVVFAQFSGSVVHPPSLLGAALLRPPALLVGAGPRALLPLSFAPPVPWEQPLQSPPPPTDRLPPPPPGATRRRPLLPSGALPPIVHTFVLQAGMRVSEAILWPEVFANLSPDFLAENYRRAYTHAPVFDPSRAPFEWDHDHWTINVVGHGLFGSEMYLRARQCHFGWGGALAFSAVGSAFWEYAVEANGSRPSALDLVYTPVAGMLLGELRYQLWRVARTIDPPVVRHIVRAAVDPFGEMERGTNFTGC